MTTLLPFFTYFGGKWRAATKYPKPDHPTIIEPFAGSAGYSLRYPSHDVILNDVDPIVTGVWSYLIRSSSTEILNLPDLEDGQTTDDLNLPQEARWLIGFWLNKGCASPRKSASKWMRSGIRPGSFWGSEIRERIASQVDQIRHWTISNRSYDSLDTRIRATWFIDPPYQGAGVGYRNGSTSIDFDALGLWCRSLKGQTLVCENEGADWLPFQPFQSIKATPGGKRTGRSAEVLWTRYSNCNRCGAPMDYCDCSHGVPVGVAA